MMAGTAKSMSLLLVIFLHIPELTNAADCDRSLPAKKKPMPVKAEEDLLCDYDKTVRPVLSNKDVTSIDVHFVITHVDFQEYRNTLSVECWFVMRWDDIHLHWNPTDYNGLRKFIVTAGDIWTPDISIYNKFAYSDSKILHANDMCVIGNNNLVLCIAHTTLQGNCVPDLRYWPFDRQNCTFTVGSWYHNGNEIRFNTTEIWVENVYREDSKWHMKNATQWQYPGVYSCCPNDTFPTLWYSFILDRKADAVIGRIVIPIVVFVIVSLMTLWFDPKSPIRMYLIALNIPCHVMLLQSFTWEISEPGDSLPYIMILLRDSLLLAALTLVETMVVRCLLDTRSNAPSWLVTSFTTIVNSKPGQVLLFSELNPENAVANLSADDGESLVETNMERPKEWYLLARALDRIYFAVYILTYFIMLLICVPK